MNLVYKEKEKDNVVENIKFTEILDVNKIIIRQAKFSILNTAIIYN